MMIEMIEADAEAAWMITAATAGAMIAEIIIGMTGDVAGTETVNVTQKQPGAAGNTGMAEAIMILPAAG